MTDASSENKKMEEFVVSEVFPLRKERSFQGIDNTSGGIYDPAR